MTALQETTDLQIVSNALHKIGEAALSSWSDTRTDLVNVCQNTYEQLAKASIAAHPWRFAMKKAELSRSAEVTPIGEWKYAFLIPGDAISSTTFALFSDSANDTTTARFEVFGRYIYSDHERLFADYKRLPPSAEWPVTFVDFLETALASRLAIPVTDTRSYFEDYQILAYGKPSDDGLGGLLGVALSQEAQSNSNDGFNTDHFIAARMGWR